jgi:hypothetical protein
MIVSSNLTNTDRILSSDRGSSSVVKLSEGMGSGWWWVARDVRLFQGIVYMGAGDRIKPVSHLGCRLPYALEFPNGMTFPNVLAI